MDRSERLNMYRLELTPPEILYKLTDMKSQTLKDTQWGPGVTHSGTGQGGLCSAGWIHAYADPILAVLLNPIHAGFSPSRLWRCSWTGKFFNDNWMKIGVQTLTTLEELPVLSVTTEQQVRFAILCALQVYRNSDWQKWTEAWFSGKDRSLKSARVARKAIGDSRENARTMVEFDAANAANAAITAADRMTIASTEWLFDPHRQGESSKEKAWAAASAADAALFSVSANAHMMVTSMKEKGEMSSKFDLIALAHKACEPVNLLTTNSSRRTT